MSTRIASSFTNGRTRQIVIMFAVMCTIMCGPAAMGQSVIDMPPPPVTNQTEATDAAGPSVMQRTGELAMSRYGSARSSAANQYGMVSPGYGYRPYGYYGGWYGWGWNPWYGYGHCGVSIRHIGGGRFVGTLCH